VAELLTAELKKKCEESPGVAENAVCAMCALALSLPPSIHSYIEVICDTLLALFRQNVRALSLPAGAMRETSNTHTVPSHQEGNNEWRQYACLISLATITHALHPTDTTRMSDIVSLLTEVPPLTLI
jgi:hypothetical protein